MNAHRKANEDRKAIATITAVTETLKETSVDRVKKLSTVKLSCSDKILEIILDNTAAQIAFLGIDGTYVRVNRIYAYACCQEPSFFPGKNHFSLYPDPEREQIFRKVITTGAAWTAHAVPYVLQNANTGYRDWHVAPVNDNNGRITGAVITLTDVTGRKVIEDELKTSESRYRLMVETTQEGVWVIDQDMKIIYTNRRMAEILACSTDQLINRNIADFSDDTTREHLARHLPDRRERGVRERQLRRADGNYTWVIESLSPLKGSDGSRVGTLGMITDINDRKNAETALQNARDEMEKRVEERTAELWKSNRLLVDEISERIRTEEALSQRHRAIEAVYAIAASFGGTIETRCDQINLSISAITGAPFTSVFRVVKSRFRIVSYFYNGECIHEGTIPLSNAPYGTVFKDRRPYQCTGAFSDPVTSRLNDSEYKPHHGSEHLQNSPFKSFLGVPVLNHTGETIGIIAVFDKKEKRYGEYDIHLVEIFAHYIAQELERDLMEEQLRHAGEMNVLGQLASGVAHEVRNPLNGILSIIEALFQDLGDVQEYKPYLHHIKAQADRLSVLMQDLLELGNPIRPATMQPESIADICSESIDIWKHSTVHTSYTVHAEIPDERIFVISDSSKLQQVFINLLENAAQHSPEGSDIRIVVRQSDEMTVHIMVIDCGTGIAAEHLRKIFNPFFTTRKKGYGLGLSIVKHIVESHGGDISIHNNNQSPGCTAEMILPVYHE